MKKLVARKGDKHLCPQTEPTTHEEGNICEGSPNVTFENFPAARVGDQILCKDGSTASIEDNSACLTINGKKSARKDDTSDHGGTLVSSASHISVADGEIFVEIGDKGKIDIGPNVSFGEKSYQGILKKVTLPGLGETYLDKDFSKNIQTFINHAKKKGVTLKFNSAYRTPEKQKKLKNDPTAITPATKSLHSAGLAVDVNYNLLPIKQQKIILDAAKKSGLSWGGYFKTPDHPHFYIDPGGNRLKLIQNATKSLK